MNALFPNKFGKNLLSLSQHRIAATHSNLCIPARPIYHIRNIDGELKNRIKKERNFVIFLKKSNPNIPDLLCLHPSMISVTSNTCDGKMRGYILKFLPNRGIWMIKHDGTSFNLISEARKLCSNSCCTVGKLNLSSFSTNN